MAPPLLIQKRSPPGKSGRAIKVRTNHFVCTKLPDGLIHHHHVEFQGAKLCKEDRALCIKYLAATNQLFKGAAARPFSFDGRANMYILSEKAMPENTYTVNEDTLKQVKTKPGKQARIISIKIEPVALVPIAALADMIKGRWSTQDESATQTAITALNIIMKMPPVYEKQFPTKGPKFYLPKQNQVEGKLLQELFQGQPVRNVLANAAELWGGYFSSIRPAVDKMILNVNRVTAPLIKSGNLVEVLKEFLGDRSGDIARINPLNKEMPAQVRWKILRFLKGMRISIDTCGPKDRFVIRDVAQDDARTSKFESENGMINVETYFLKQHKLRLKYPELPVVQVTAKAFYPMEVCNVWVGSNFFKKLNAQQTSDMLKSRFVTLAPGIKRRAIECGLQQLSINSAFHQSWNLQVRPDFMEVSARQLQSPQLVYKNARGQDAPVRTNDGGWMTKGMHAFRPGMKVLRWVVVVFANDAAPKNSRYDGMPMAQVRDALVGFIKGCKDFGITFGTETPAVLHVGPNAPDARLAIVNASKKAGYTPQTPPNLVVTFSDASTRYDAIKKACDIDLGVPSQNLQIGKADGNRGGYWVNVAFKVNAKLAGVNHTIQGGLPGVNVPTMLMGADVTHPPSGSCMPSIAAVVATFDKNAVEYAATAQVQLATKEIIEDLHQITVQHLQNFFAKTKTRPQRIVFFRDGVSEGQFLTVTQQEVEAIKSACHAVDPKHIPAITFIVCAKRHHTQMFPVSDKEADRSGNSRSGTVIDTDIVHPAYDDFYLLSHGGLLGTSKPTHYTILLDEAKLGKDVLQNMAYQSAFLMPRSTKAISIAAPAQFAHMVCDRTRKYFGTLETEADRLSASNLNEEQKRAQLLELAKKNPHAVHGNLRNVMFYM